MSRTRFLCGCQFGSRGLRVIVTAIVGVAGVGLGAGGCAGTPKVAGPASAVDPMRATQATNREGGGKTLPAPETTAAPSRAVAKTEPVVAVPVAPAAAAIAPAAAGGESRDGRPPLDMANISEKEWLASVRQKLADRLSVDPAAIRLSPSKRRAAVVRGPAVPKPAEIDEAKLAESKAAKGKGRGKSARKVAAQRRPAPPRRYQIIVADIAGKVEHKFRAVTVNGSDEPPKDFRFLSEDSLIYEVVKPAPPPPAKLAKKHATKAARAEERKRRSKGDDSNVDDEPEADKRLFVIQPLGRRTRPLRCEGIHFSWNKQRTHIASVGGPPAARYVAVDGVKVYPRRGQSRISGAPAWSKDGLSLAFVENRPKSPARLVLLAEFDNPTGDTFWDLPSVPSMQGTQAYFTGHDRLVVGRSALKPLFAAPFTKERSTPFEP